MGKKTSQKKGNQVEETKTSTAKVERKDNGTTEEHDQKPHLSLLKNPVTTLYYFMLVLIDFGVKILKFAMRNIIWIALIAAFFVVPRVIDHPYHHLVVEFDEMVYFAAYWIILGVASSIGLGTGLHTFVLYLGPYIAKVTMVANECNAIPEYLPSRWNMKAFGPCPPGERPTISLANILMTVQLEAFLWGLGTALGELPPYFVARAARMSGKKADEVEEVENIKQAHSLMDRAKIMIYKHLQKHSFITVLLCASIPNPLFDLAGITCGHFGIGFATFFTATAIGKAIIKVHLQMIFVIVCFSKHRVEHLLSFMERNLPFLKETLSKSLEKQKQTLHNPDKFSEGDKPLVARLWDLFILGMITFFIISIVNSLANNYLEEKLAREEALEDDKKKKSQPAKKQVKDEKVEDKKPQKEEKKPAKDEKKQPAKDEKKPADNKKPAEDKKPAETGKKGKQGGKVEPVAEKPKEVKLILLKAQRNQRRRKQNNKSHTI